MLMQPDQPPRGGPVFQAMIHGRFSGAAWPVREFPFRNVREDVFMKKSISVMWASVLVAGLSLTAAGAIACDGHDKASTETSSIEKVSDSGSCAATKASMAGGSACGMKS